MALLTFDEPPPILCGAGIEGCWNRTQQFTLFPAHLPLLTGRCNDSNWRTTKMIWHTGIRTTMNIHGDEVTDEMCTAS